MTPRRDRDATNSRMLVVSPCRDEATYLERTFTSMVAQTLRPALWVIVDDGSIDETPALLDRLAEGLDWVRVVHLETRPARNVGPAVIAAFDVGLASAGVDGFDYICKIDMDLILPAGYLAACLAEFDADARLGSFSGKVFFRDARGAEVSEGVGDDVSVGALKMYRAAAFAQIGGLVPRVMWDGIDCHRLRLMGWRVRSVPGADLWVEHLRPMGSSQGDVVAGRLRWGRGQYAMGAGFLWILASGVYRLFKSPVLVGGAAIVIGYIQAAWAGCDRLDDGQFRRFLRRYHRLALLGGKRFAVTRIEAEGQGVWDPNVRGPWGDPFDASEEDSADGS